MEGDRELQRSVIDELGWEPGVKAAEIGVSVKDGVVTLSGNVDSYPEKWAAQGCVKGLLGVTSVADEIEVRLPGASEYIDADIARAAENVLDWNVSVPNGRLKLTVEKGWITLEGAVDWQFQRVTAEKALRHLFGVRGISNQIVMVPQTTPVEVAARIEAAMKRSAKVDAQAIKVTLLDNKITLSGKVRSWAEREEAVRAAWAAPGVFEVTDQLRIES
jgi:osmotically-inducible protein OsmY